MKRIPKSIRFMLCMTVILFATTTAVMSCYYAHCENTLSGRDEMDKDANTRKNEIYYSFVGQVDTGEAHTESVSFFRQIGADVKSYAV